jgi:BMFP domain-containing protein YqiC
MVRRLLEQLPAGVRNMDADLRKNLKAGLSQVLRDMDLVTREEYGLQTRVLARTREKLEQLEQRADALERRLEQGLEQGRMQPGREGSTD